jgi:hypothetical protein
MFCFVGIMAHPNHYAVIIPVRSSFFILHGRRYSKSIHLSRKFTIFATVRKMRYRRKREIPREIYRVNPGQLIDGQRDRVISTPAIQSIERGKGEGVG